jgi:hypothetical protein
VIAAAKEKQRLIELEAREKEAEKQRKIDATKRWIEQEREWDSFVEDAQVSARERKERGDWHEPPVGVPGAKYAAHQDDEPLGYHPALSPEVIARMLMTGAMDVEEIRAWGQPAPVRVVPVRAQGGIISDGMAPIFNEAPDRPRCTNGKTIYTNAQAMEVIAQFSLLGISQHYTFEPHKTHYHLTRKVR